MGDVLSLIEQAERTMERRGRQLAGRLLEGRFTFDDFLAQLQQVRKLGPSVGS